MDLLTGLVVCVNVVREEALAQINGCFQGVVNAARDVDAGSDTMLAVDVEASEASVVVVVAGVIVIASLLYWELILFVRNK